MSYVGITEKDPDSEVYYEIDWRSWNRGATIVESLWFVPMSMTVEDESVIDSEITRAKFLGGTHKNNSKVVNRMTNSIGEIWDAKLLIKIRD